MLLPSGIGNVPTLNVHSDVWNCLESYMICMLLVCRLKIIPTSNLKLIIFFWYCHQYYFHSFKLLSFVASTRHAPLTSRVQLKLTIKPTAALGEAADIYAMCVFLLALASFYLGTLFVRCPPTQYLTINRPRSHLNISINNRQMRTFYVAILCACMVGRHLCSMVALFHYLGTGSSR